MRMIFLRHVPGQNNDIRWLLVNSEALTKCFSLGNWTANRCEMNFSFLFPSHRSGNTTLTEAHAAASVLLIKAKAPKGLLEAHNGFVIILFITLRQLVGTGVFLMSLEEMIRRIITSSLRSQERERGVCRYWDNCAFMEWCSPQEQVNISGEHGEHRVFWIKYRSWGCQVVSDSQSCTVQVYIKRQNSLFLTFSLCENSPCSSSSWPGPLWSPGCAGKLLALTIRETQALCVLPFAQMLLLWEEPQPRQSSPYRAFENIQHTPGILRTVKK